MTKDVESQPCINILFWNVTQNIKFLRILIEVKPFINDCFAFILVILSHIILCEVFLGSAICMRDNAFAC